MPGLLIFDTPFPLYLQLLAILLPVLSKNQNIFWKIKNLNTCYYYDKFGINMYFLKRFDAQKYQLFEYYI